jgi:outer membrane protein assembly factor BamE (lipoprotein component of BamABCDE complex)
MKTFALSVCFVVMAVFLCSCEFFSYGHIVAYNNRKKLAKVREGMTKQQTLDLMGEPLKKELYNKPNFWFYYTELRWADGLNTRDECTPIVFQDGAVIGWGNDYYERNYEFKDWDEEVYNKNEREAMERAFNRLSKELEEKYDGKGRKGLNLEDMRALKENALKILNEKDAQRVEKAVEKTLDEPDVKKVKKNLEKDAKKIIKEPSRENVKKVEKDLKDSSKTDTAKKLKKEIKEEEAGKVDSIKELDKKYGKKLDKDSTKNLKRELDKQLDAQKESKELKDVQKELNQELNKKLDGESKKMNETIKKIDSEVENSVNESVK